MGEPNFNFKFKSGIATGKLKNSKIDFGKIYGYHGGHGGHDNRIFYPVRIKTPAEVEEDRIDLIIQQLNEMMNEYRTYKFNKHTFPNEVTQEQDAAHIKILETIKTLLTDKDIQTTEMNVSDDWIIEPGEFPLLVKEINATFPESPLSRERINQLLKDRNRVIRL